MDMAGGIASERPNLSRPRQIMENDRRTSMLFSRSGVSDTFMVAPERMSSSNSCWSSSSSYNKGEGVSHVKGEASAPSPSLAAVN